MYLMVNRFKSNATVEQFQEPGPNPLYVDYYRRKKKRPNHAYSVGSNYTLLMRKSGKADLHWSQHPGQTASVMGVIHHCSRLHQLKSGTPPGIKGESHGSWISYPRHLKGE